jgi:hypothetical protein
MIIIAGHFAARLTRPAWHNPSAVIIRESG